MVSALVDSFDWNESNFRELVFVKNSLDNCFSRDSFIGLDGVFLITLAEVDAV